MNRKLPPDHEVAALSEGGMTYREIAARYSVNLSMVAYAMDRFRQKPITQQKLIKATTSDKTFVAAGSQPIEHRETQGTQAKGFDDLASAYKPLRTSLDDCRDLLREWGAS